MCLFDAHTEFHRAMLLAQGWRPVRRKTIVYRRLHAFATERWAEASTPRRARFWRRVMERCVREIEHLEPPVHHGQKR